MLLECNQNNYFINTANIVLWKVFISPSYIVVDITYISSTIKIFVMIYVLKLHLTHFHKQVAYCCVLWRIAILVVMEICNAPDTKRVLLGLQQTDTCIIFEIFSNNVYFLTFLGNNMCKVLKLADFSNTFCKKDRLSSVSSANIGINVSYSLCALHDPPLRL